MDIENWLQVLVSGSPPVEFSPDAGSPGSHKCDEAVTRNQRVQSADPTRGPIILYSCLPDGLEKLGLDQRDSDAAISDIFWKDYEHSHVRQISRWGKQNVEVFERRPRRKTRADLYESLSGARKRQRQLSRKIPSGADAEGPRQKSRKLYRGIYERLLLDKFQTSKLSKNRLTLQNSARVGLITKGRASAALRGRGLPDLVFAKMRFLQDPMSKLQEMTDGGSCGLAGQQITEQMLNTAAVPQESRTSKCSSSSLAETAQNSTAQSKLLSLHSNLDPHAEANQDPDVTLTASMRASAQAQQHSRFKLHFTVDIEPGELNALRDDTDPGHSRNKGGQSSTHSEVYQNRENPGAVAQDPIPELGGPAMGRTRGCIAAVEEWESITKDHSKTSDDQLSQILRTCDTVARQAWKSKGRGNNVEAYSVGALDISGYPLGCYSSQLANPLLDTRDWVGASQQALPAAEFAHDTSTHGLDQGSTSPIVQLDLPSVAGAYLEDVAAAEHGSAVEIVEAGNPHYLDDNQEKWYYEQMSQLDGLGGVVVARDDEGEFDNHSRLGPSRTMIIDAVDEHCPTPIGFWRRHRLC